jgi:hypothetical protein
VTWGKSPSHGSPYLIGTDDRTIREKNNLSPFRRLNLHTYSFKYICKFWRRTE